MLFLYLSAFLTISGTWSWFIYNKEKEKSYLLLTLVSVGLPFVLFYAGINLADNIGSNSLVFGSIFLLIILLANSILLILTIIVVSIKKKERM